MRHPLAVNLPADLVAFVRDLQTIRDQGYTLTVEPEKLEPAKVRAALLEGRPLLDWVAFPVPKDEFRSLFLEVAATIGKHRLQLGEAVEKLVRFADQNDLAVLALKAAKQDGAYFRSLAVDTGVTPELFLFVANQAIRPFLTTFSRKYVPGLKLELWRRSYCPVCGQPSSLAQLVGEEGIRELICVHCQTHWEFHRLACPHCANEEPELLGCLTADKYPGFQIHFCRVCKRYVKTVDTRKSLQPALDLDEFDTLILDVIAQQQGYQNEETALLN